MQIVGYIKTNKDYLHGQKMKNVLECLIWKLKNNHFIDPLISKYESY